MTQRLKFLERQEIDSSTFTGSYLALGSPLTEAAVILKIVNDSTVDVDVSTDGTTDHDFVPKNGFVLYDLRTNKGFEPASYIPKNTQFFVSGAAGTGNVYLIVLGDAS